MAALTNAATNAPAATSTSTEATAAALRLKENSGGSGRCDGASTGLRSPPKSRFLIGFVAEILWAPTLIPATHRDPSHPSWIYGMWLTARHKSAEVGRFTPRVTDDEADHLELAESLSLLGQKRRADLEAKEALKAERVRRRAALEAMRTAAEASPARSPQRAHWLDFVAATTEVERLRAECRRTGRRYSDGWSGPRAVGAQWDDGRDAVWVDWAAVAPHPVLIDNGFSLDDVQQGQLGDCWFISTLAHLVKAPHVLDSAFVTAEANPEGVFCVRLWTGSAWQWVFMDSTFPCHNDSYHEVGCSCHWGGAPNPKEGKYFWLAATHSSSHNEFWASFLEKAFAKLHGSYSAIIGGVGGGVGAFPLSLFFPNSLPGFTVELLRSSTWAELESAHARGWRMTEMLSSSAWAELESAYARGWRMTANASKLSAQSMRNVVGRTRGADADGVVRDHAFTLLRVFSLPPRGKEEELRLLQLRNPHGQGEWTGAFSDKDLASWSPRLRAATGYVPEESGDDGVFWMPWEAVCRKFESVSVTPTIRLVNEGGTWHKAVAHGVIPPGLPSSADITAYPQFLLAAPHAGKIYAWFDIDEPPSSATTERTVLYLCSHAGGTGLVPLKERDFYHSSAEPRATALHLTAVSGVHGASITHDLSEEAARMGSLVLIPKRPNVQAACRFMLSVVSESAFVLRIAQGSSSTADGVVVVSDASAEAAPPLPPVPQAGCGNAPPAPATMPAQRVVAITPLPHAAAASATVAQGVGAAVAKAASSAAASAAAEAAAVAKVAAAAEAAAVTTARPTAAHTSKAQRWLARTDPATGKRFFVHIDGPETSWTFPPGIAEGTARLITSSYFSKTTASGERYYVNTATMATAWERPAGYVSDDDEGTAPPLPAAASTSRSAETVVVNPLLRGTAAAGAASSTWPPQQAGRGVRVAAEPPVTACWSCCPGLWFSRPLHGKAYPLSSHGGPS